MTDTFELQLTRPYGVITIALARELYTSGNYKQLIFTLYLDAKRKCKDGKWDFSVTDIARETGIDRRLVNKIAKAFVDAGNLSASGRTPKGSRKYQLKHLHFERYLNGKLHVKSEKVLCIGCIAPNAHQPQHQAVESSLPRNGSSDNPEDRCALNAGLVCIECTSGVHSMDTKISDKMSEEDKGLSENPTPTKQLVRITASKEELAHLRTKYLPSGRRKGECSSEVITPAPSCFINLSSGKAGESSLTGTTAAPPSTCYTSSTYGLAASPLVTVPAQSVDTMTTTETTQEPLSKRNQALEGNEVR
jgi:hypothetical protein